MSKFNPIYSVRKANLSDVMYFYEVIHNNNESSIDLNDFHQTFKIKMKNKNVQFFILIDQFGHNAGSAIAESRIFLTESSSFFEIQHFFIAPKYRKHLGAETLYQAIEASASEKKCFKIVITTLPNATINQRFYAKKGFKFAKKVFVKNMF